MNRFEKRRDLDAKLDVVLHARFVYMAGLFLVPIGTIGSIVSWTGMRWSVGERLFWSSFFGYQAMVWTVFAIRARPISRMSPISIRGGTDSFAWGEFLLLFALPILVWSIVILFYVDQVLRA
jgi:hypothetical protein